MLMQRKRSFRADAQSCIQLISPNLKILQSENIPIQGPTLLVMNHYSRPGFPAWWIALGISAAIPLEIHWIMTTAWTHLGPLEPLSRWLFPRLAEVYDFTTSPPMPPDPAEVEARARAVRQVLNFTRQAPAPVVGLAPEGRDNPKGVLGDPPSGVGRFIEKLLPTCQQIIPIGVYEDSANLCLSFGQAFQIAVNPQLPSDQRDHFLSRQVMQAIAQQLPPALRGKYQD